MIADTFQTWRSRLERYCALLLRSRHDAEEVVQDVFARLCAAPDRYQLGREPEVLLFRLARNRCIDTRRKQAPRSNADLETTVPDASDRDDLRRDLEMALATLRDDERETLLLTAVDGLGYREVAAILGCSLGTVAARRGTAILKLRERLSR